MAMLLTNYIGFVGLWSILCGSQLYCKTNVQDSINSYDFQHTHITVLNNNELSQTFEIKPLLWFEEKDNLNEISLTYRDPFLLSYLSRQ
jgi:hypothetical protein